MKNLICLLSLVLLISCHEEQKTNSDYKSSTERDTASKAISDSKLKEDFVAPHSVAEIKEAYAITVDKMNNGQLDSVSFEYNCQEERSGKVTYFSEKGVLRSIRHQYNEYDHHEAIDQYFLNEDSTLFFAYLNRLSWSFDSVVGKDGATKDDIQEQRIYVVNKQAIQCLEKRFTTRSQATDNPTSESVPNKQVVCKPIKPLLKNFQQLLDFKNSSNHSCL